MNGSELCQNWVVTIYSTLIHCQNGYDTACEHCFKKYCIDCANDGLITFENRLICKKHVEICGRCDKVTEIWNLAKKQCSLCFSYDIKCIAIDCGKIDGSVFCKKHSYPCDTVNCKIRLSVFKVFKHKIRGKCYCHGCYNSYKTGIECLMLKFKYRCNYRDMVNYTLNFLL